MGKILIIAEKPSLGSELRSMLTSYYHIQWQRNQGYYESEYYLLCWFFGHLLTALKPDEYDERLKHWRMQDLPIIPENLRYHYHGDTEKQGKLLVLLARRATSIINATDPDREGQAIFRTWYEKEKITLPVQRLWATSLAPADLKKSWELMKSDAAYDNLAAAARLRAYSDWLVGMNASRAYSIKFNKKIPIGRVLTATLALIVKRDAEVENFKESFYYLIKGGWCSIQFTFIDDDGNVKIDDKTVAERLLEAIQETLFRLLDFKKERKIEHPPKPFSMPDLQKAANTRFGFALDKTLKLAQSLYEKKIITYPRTDSPFCAPADRDAYYETIDRFATPQQKQLLIPKGEKVVCLRDTDASHTAIIPTGIVPTVLSTEQKQLFDLICRRFITAFLRPHLYYQTTIFISDGIHRMRAIVMSDIDPGWRITCTGDHHEQSHQHHNRNAPEEEMVEEDEIQTISVDEKNLHNRSEKLMHPAIITKKKAKPNYFTPATLLSAMIHAGKALEDKELKEIMREVEGLGTAATRDQFPVHLQQYGYIEQRGKYLISTQFGRWLIPHVQNDLSCAAFTASLERKLRQIEYGSYDPQIYNKEIQLFTTAIVSFVVNAPAAQAPLVPEGVAAPRPGDRTAIVCPRCGKTLQKFSKGYSCFAQSGGCGFVVWNTLCGKKLTDTVLICLIKKKRTAKIEGFYSKSKDKKFDACLILKNDFTVGFEF
ncbi:MAG: topoisomerase C-terminal repeat-containing protein [Chitinivibrionales bacterium]|nr:topoisomerase C-terminal repeat-containing protein [Chitinivibrionales bacterium]